MTNNKKTQDRDDDLDFQEDKISIVETSDGVRKEEGKEGFFVDLISSHACCSLHSLYNVTRYCT